jgi:Uma2 family endonuclease
MMPVSLLSLSTVGNDRLQFPFAAEHNMVMPAIRRRWTAADVRALMDEERPWPRYELIGGELIVTPAPGNPHQMAVTEILRVIADYVDREALGVTYFSPADLELKPDTISQPDIFVVPFPETPLTVLPKGWTHIKSLLLAVEVISPGSIRHDRVEKRDHYMTADVSEYWIVDCDARAMERWTPRQERPELLRDQMVWRPVRASEPLVIDLPELFARIQDKAHLRRRI